MIPRPCAVEGPGEDGAWDLDVEKRPPNGSQEGPLADENSQEAARGDGDT